MEQEEGAYKFGLFAKPMNGKRDLPIKVRQGIQCFR